MNLGALKTEWDQIGPNGILRKNSHPSESYGMGLFGVWLPDDARGNDKTLDFYLVNVYYHGIRSSEDPCIRAVIDAAPTIVRTYAEQSVPGLLHAAQAAGFSAAQTAYVFGTAEHESAMGKFMSEIWGPTALQKNYEGNSRLGNTVAGDGYLYRGRGYVQITGRTNYTYFSNRLGVDLVSNPTLATDPAIAGQITVIGMQDGTFTGKRLDDFINDQKTDFFGARAVINGDKFVNGTKIENHAKNYLKALVNCNYRSGVPGRGRP